MNPEAQNSGKPMRGAIVLSSFSFVKPLPLRITRKLPSFSHFLKITIHSHQIIIQGRYNRNTRMVIKYI